MLNETRFRERFELFTKEELMIYCIYNADGSILGEFKYFLKKYFYGLKCSMCEITHNSFTKKKEWERKLFNSKLKLKVLHLDEQPESLSKFSNGKTPCVIKKGQDGYKFVFTKDELEEFNGNVDLFFEALKKLN